MKKLMIVVLIGAVLFGCLAALSAKDKETDSADFTQQLQGKKCVNFGDSIFGNTEGPTSISGYITSLSGATTYNVAFGGCFMSSNVQYWDAFGMYKLTAAMVSKDWSLQDAAIKGPEKLPWYFEAHLATLKSIDFSDIDYITISYGTNDYTGGKSIDTEGIAEDLNTYVGALRYSLRKIYEAYPNVKIVVCTPTYRFWSDSDGNFQQDSDTRTYNAAQNTLQDFVEAAKAVAKEFKTPSLDMYYELGINQYNRLNFFTTKDGTHPNEAGRKRIAEKICAVLADWR
jgi:lysophospholipase L1-like esterase